MQKRVAIRAEQLLFLFVENGCSHVGALVAHGRHGDLGDGVLAPMPIEVTFPEALQTEIVPTKIAVEGRRIVLALVAYDALLYDLPVRYRDEHGAMVGPKTLLVHRLKAEETEVILAVAAKDLGRGRV